MKKYFAEAYDSPTSVFHSLEDLMEHLNDTVPARWPHTVTLIEDDNATVLKPTVSLS